MFGRLAPIHAMGDGQERRLWGGGVVANVAFVGRSEGSQGDEESFASLCDGNMPCINITSSSGGLCVGAVGYGWAGGGESSEGARGNRGLMQLSRGGAQTQHSIVSVCVSPNV